MFIERAIELDMRKVGRRHGYTTCMNVNRRFISARCVCMQIDIRFIFNQAWAIC